MTKDCSGPKHLFILTLLLCTYKRWAVCITNHLTFTVFASAYTQVQKLLN